MSEQVSKAMDEAKAKKAKEAEEAAKSLGDVEAMISTLEHDADLEQARLLTTALIAPVTTVYHYTTVLFCITTEYYC